MVRLGVVRAGIPFLIAAGVAVLSTLGSTGASSGAGQSASIALLAVDSDISGNGPRTVGAVDDCVSASVGQPVEVDIVVPSPGIPADRGTAAYQFSILYDPAVVWITADDSDMLLAQAAGSNVISIADPKPDNNGVYQSWGVDFGPSGIEPAGSSETGPGVIARITLLPQGNGVSALVLSGVLVIDDASERISLESVQSATIHVGEPCPEPSPNDGVDDGQGNGVTDDGDSGMQEGAANGVNDDGDTDGNGAAAGVAAAPSPSPAGAVPTGGGAPPPAGSASVWLIVSGLVATLGGAGLLIAGKLAFRPRTRRHTFPQQD